MTFFFDLILPVSEQQNAFSCWIFVGYKLKAVELFIYFKTFGLQPRNPVTKVTAKLRLPASRNRICASCENVIYLVIQLTPEDFVLTFGRQPWNQIIEVIAKLRPFSIRGIQGYTREVCHKRKLSSAFQIITPDFTRVIGYMDGGGTFYWSYLSSMFPMRW